MREFERGVARRLERAALYGAGKAVFGDAKFAFRRGRGR